MKIREGDGDRTATIGRGVMKAFARTILCAYFQLGLHPLLVVSCVEPFNKYVWKRATMPESNQCIAQDGNRMDEHIRQGALAYGRSSCQQFGNYKKCSPRLTFALFDAVLLLTYGFCLHYLIFGVRRVPLSTL